MLLGAVGPYVIFDQPTVITQAAKRKSSRRHVKRVKKQRKKRRKVDHKKRSKKKVKVKTRQTIPWANVYIAISPKAEDYQAARDAVKAWTATKSVKFKFVKKAKQAFIIIRRKNYGDTNWAGEEQYKRSGKRTIVSQIRLNDYFLNQVDYPIKVDVVEHELGHSIGLDHNDAEPSVMNSIIDPTQAYPIQQVDIDNVKALYDEK